MADEFTISRMRVEWRQEPLGLDNPNPSLSWTIQSNQRGQKQTAYRIFAASRPDWLEEGLVDLWDSGRIESAETAQVIYRGQKLTSRQRVWWNVTVWDKSDAPHTSPSASWEMGLLRPEDWTAAWIGSSLVGGKFNSTFSPFLRHSWIPAGEVSSARLYITALGVYEVSINGNRVGKDIFAPGWTDYHRRVAYQTYDVTALITSGENAIGAVLGDGWYCGHIASSGRQNYGDRPWLFAQLELTLADGSRQVIATDETWRWSTGPILESDFLMGESFDARRILKGWASAGFDETGWQPVVLSDAVSLAVVAQNGPTVQAVQELQPVGPPVEFYGWAASRWVYDLGQNMTGRVRLNIKGNPGDTVTLRYAEVLKPDGTLYTENLRSARATDNYTLAGGGEEVYEPVFTFHGFRYVELSNFHGKPDQFSITGVVLHSDMTPTGTFECSDSMINQLQHNITWGQKGNFLDVPTDCPQRDERLGWTGDAQVFVRTAAFNFDVAGFFNRWQQSLADSQGSTGNIPSVIPSSDLVPGDGGPAWADAVVICPWTIYQVYGDRRLLFDYYDNLVRYVEYLKANSIGMIRCHPRWKGSHGYGDWLSINAETPKDLIGTAFFAYVARLLSQIAETIGRLEDVESYRALFEEVRKAFVNRFVTPDGLVAGQTQTAYVLALYFDLLPAELRSTVADALVLDIQNRGMHLSTGFVGAPYLLQTLTQTGHIDVAFELMHQKTWPSWLYPVTRGATTIWERWDGWTDEKGFQDPGMNSFNHYAYGSVGSWLYQVVAGIEIDPAHPGYERVIIHPRPGGGLTYASAAYDSVRGIVSSRWDIGKKAIVYTLSIPANCVALVYIPAASLADVNEAGGMDKVLYLRMEDGCAVYQVESGQYSFTSQKIDF